VLARDVQDDVDRRIGGEESLANHFRNVEFGALPGLPAIDAGGLPATTGPVRREQLAQLRPARALRQARCICWDAAARMRGARLRRVRKDSGLPL
jgi:hypothetical protein